ncbi:hypothetical protein [Pseudofrankia sp. EUN1h]|uniref:hypothetical protein n=2 Tax=Pseudofrankia TaxID=2994363 RepID=UPI0012FE976E|nr:hypothetical protein [Pseudofrankia sp. EUN1h]
MSHERSVLLAERALGTQGDSPRWRVWSAMARLRRAIRRRDDAALGAVVLIGRSNERAFTKARDLLAAAAGDPRISVWLAYGLRKGSRHEDLPLFASVLTSPAKGPVEGVPPVHLTKILTVDESRFPRRERYRFFEVYNGLPRMLVDLLTQDATPPAEIATFLRETDNRAVLNALARAWTAGVSWQEPSEVLTPVVMANDHLPRGGPQPEPGDILIAIIKGRDDVVEELLRSDRTAGDAVETLLDGLSASGALSDSCWRILHGLESGAALDSLRAKLLRGPRRSNKTTRLIMEMGFFRPSEAYLLLDLFQHGDLDLVASVDPGGVNLRAAYHSVSLDWQTSIRDFVKWLVAELAKPVEARSTAGAPRVNAFPADLSISPQARQVVDGLSAVIAADDADWRRRVADREERRRSAASRSSYDVPSCG